MRHYISTLKHILLITALAAVIFGCSAANQDSPLSLLDANGDHPGDWIEGHGSYAKPDGSLCIDCHGDDLDGGITSVSCSTASIGGQTCHANGPGLHPPDWLDKSSADFHALAYSPASNYCSICHDAAPLSLPPGYNCLDCHFSEDGTQRIPAGSSFSHGNTSAEHKTFTANEAQVCVNCHTANISFGNQGSCHNCHEIHEKPYLDHNLAVPTSNEFTSQCSACHSITDPPIGSARVCTSCHIVGSPYSRTNCTSCHRRPPNTGEHGEHQDEGVSCNECHQDAGSGSGLNHFYDNDVDVKFSDSGFTYNIGGRCSGKCHSENHTNENW
ncbi:hypothetical protein MUP29_02205 [bacterium]|nr:hypothetical protein [bacterium]